MNPPKIHLLKTWSPVLVFRGEVLRKGLDPGSTVFVSGLTHRLGCCEKGDIWKMKPSWGSRPQEAYSILKGLFPPSLLASAVRFPLCCFSLTIPPHQRGHEAKWHSTELSLWAQLNLPLKKCSVPNHLRQRMGGLSFNGSLWIKCMVLLLKVLCVGLERWLSQESACCVNTKIWVQPPRTHVEKKICVYIVSLGKVETEGPQTLLARQSS